MTTRRRSGANAAGTTATRNAIEVILEDEPERGSRPLGDRWAIIVGISKYEHSPRINQLSYAARDAEAFYALLQQPACGRFPKDHMTLLLNENATYMKIRRALRGFLGQPKEDDLVIIYFACHGLRDQDKKSDVPYLLNYDADPDDFDSTATLMSDIHEAVQDVLKAKRVVVIADTCYSGALSDTRGETAHSEDAKIVNTYLKNVLASRPGLSVLTSTQGDQLAKEGKDWNGHGVFTHYLIEGMKGAAAEADGRVTLGKLYDYVQTQVKLATHDEQIPHLTANSVRELPLADHRRQRAEEAFALARQLAALGRMLNEPVPLWSAMQGFAEVLTLKPESDPLWAEAKLARGCVLFDLGQHTEAIKVLGHRLVNKRPEAMLLTGVAYAKQRDYAAAITLLESFVQQHPGDDNASWATAYVDWLKNNTGSKRYALLIGINKYKGLGEVTQLQGCVNDVALLKTALIKHCGFAKDNIITLTDHQATHTRILKELQVLAQKAQPADTVIVLFSGHGIPDTTAAEIESAPYLITYDTTARPITKKNKKPAYEKAIYVQELHEGMNAIAARSKALMLDTHPRTEFIELAYKTGSYVVLLASETGFTTEAQFTLNGKALTCGAFTGAVAQYLEQNKASQTTYGQLRDGAAQIIKARGFDQQPMITQHLDQLIFTRDDCLMRLFDFSRRPQEVAYADLDTGQLKRVQQDVATTQIILPTVLFRLGCALAGKRDYANAVAALERITGESDLALHARLWLGLAHIGNGQRDAAQAELKQLAASAPRLPKPACEVLWQTLFHLGEDELAMQVLPHVDRDGGDGGDGIGSMDQSQEAVKNQLYAAVLAKPNGEQHVRALLARAAEAASEDDPFYRSIHWLLADTKTAQHQLTQRHALLIGVGQFAGDLPKLNRPADDVKHMQQLLSEQFDFEPGHVTTLVDEQATYEAVLQACARLKERVLPGDAVVMYYSGHVSSQASKPGQPGNARDDYFLYDSARNVTDSGQNWANTITDQQVYDLLAELPVANKLGIFDACGEALMARTAQTQAFALLAASQPDEAAWESSAYGAVTGSLFTTALVKALKTKQAVGAPVRTLLKRMGNVLSGGMQTAGTKKSGAVHSSQRPYYTGDLGKPLLTTSSERPLTFAERLGDMRKSLRQKMTLADVAQHSLTRLMQAPAAEAVPMLSQKLEPNADANPEIRLNLGLAYAALGQNPQASALLDRAVALYSDAIIMAQEHERGDDYADLRYARARFHYGRTLLEQKIDLKRAVSELEQACQLEPQNGGAFYYHGQAIETLVERDLLSEAATSYQVYLKQGAPLGNEDHLRAFLAARNTRTQTSKRKSK